MLPVAVCMALSEEIALMLVKFLNAFICIVLALKCIGKLAGISIEFARLLAWPVFFGRCYIVI